LANANASSASDGNTAVNDEDDDIALLSTKGPAQIHRPFFQERRESIFQQGLRARLIETTSTLNLILPSSSSRHINGARSISSSASNESPALLTSVSSANIEKDDSISRPRSLSTSASQAQETIISEASFPPPPPPTSERRASAKYENERAVGLRSGKETLQGDAARAYEKLADARRTGKVHLMQSSVDIFRQSPRDHLSTSGFNMAMQSVLEIKDHDSSAKVLELFGQMIETNCPPTRTTYGYLIRALCQRDAEQFSRYAEKDAVSPPDADFKQALAFCEVVHTSPPGFSTVRDYNSLLHSCALRGDAEVACSIIDKLSANKYVTPNTWTFLYLLDAFRRSASPKLGQELAEEDIARTIQSCEHVFAEFEVFRSSTSWKNDEMKEVTVWNSMISMYVQMGSPDKGIELIQKMMEGEPLSKGKQIPPRPTQGTAKLVIRDLVAAGDIEGGLNWLESIMQLDRGMEEGRNNFMPLPSDAAVQSLIKGVMRSLPLEQSESLEHLPIVIKANRILKAFYDKLQSSPEYLSTANYSKNIDNGDWRSMLSVNATHGTRLIKEGHLAEADTLSDLSLSHIKQQFEVFADQLSFVSLQRRDANPDAVFLLRIRESVRAVLQVIRLLLLQDRFHDAASCFSYAIAAWPPTHWHSEVSPLYLSEVCEVSFPIMGFRWKSETAHLEHRLQQFSELWEINPEADLKMHAHIALTYILPAVQQRQTISQPFHSAAKQIYMAARKEGDAKELNIDVRGWGYLVDALVSEGIEAELDVAFLEVLVNDLAALSEEERDLLSLQVMFAHLPKFIGPEKALEYLQRIRPATTTDTLNAEATPVQEAQVQEVEQSTIDSVNDGHEQQSVTEMAPPTTPATSIGSPETASEYNASLSYTLPPIVTIDADLGQALAHSGRFANQKRIKFAKSLGKGNKAQDNAARLQPLYERLTRSIQEDGVYPSPDGICELMNQFGRTGAVEKVKELYLIGCHVVAALGGDPNWQMHSWYELEDTMTAALAHGGDHRLANAHRIALVEAGHAPRADTYAALITVIRDTTDDVMVAEELFEESQRLGVTPTLYLYNTVLSKLSRARKAERAMQLFDEMRNRGIQPSSITYGAILNACTRTGDEVNAERFFAMMEADAQFKPQAPPYNTMLQFYTQTKPDRQKAMIYYEKACQRNVEHTSHTYKLLLDMYGSIAPIDVDGMRNIFGRLIADFKVEVQGNHWASLIWAYGRQDLEKAIDIYKSIPSHVATVRQGKSGQEPDALAFEALLGVFLEHKRMDLIEESIRGREEKGYELTAYVANVVIKAFASLVPDVGLERARQVFEKMQDPPMGMAAAGNHPLQRQHVSGVQRDKSLQVGGYASGAQMAGFERLKREPSTFEAMIRAEMEHGNLQEATALIHRMQSRGYPPIVVAHAQDILVQQPAVVLEV
jgi:pentatricopeptide repeat protein